MRPRRSAPRARVVLVSGAFFFAALIVWVSIQVASGDIDSNDKLASVISMYAAIVSFPVAMVALVVTVRQVGHHEQVGDSLDATADVLAKAVRAQWEAEERIRRVHDPFPLPVRWTNADEHLSDHWECIHRSAHRNDPIPLAGQDDEIAEVFERVPSHRLVILGKAGAGKTILTSRFALAQLARRVSSADGPVPIIFSLGSWDPTGTALRTWLSEQLLTTYPALAGKDGAGTTTADALLATGRIMPVLDGFDEIPERLRGRAINTINAALGPNDRLLMTSRPEEYSAAVETGDVLTAAAVVELADLEIGDVVRYLPLTTRKTIANDVGPKWHAVMSRLRNPVGDPAAESVAAALRTPLMVTLARAGFSDTRADPSELLDFQADMTGLDVEQRRRMVEHRLFAGFVPAAYSDNPTDPETSGFHRADLDRVRRWLGFLAGHLDAHDSYDIAWWRLVDAVPRGLRGITAFLVIAVPCFLVIGSLGWWATWEPGGREMWWLCGLLFVGAISLVGGLLIGLWNGLRVTPTPSRVRLQLSRRNGSGLASLISGLNSWRAMVWLAVWAGGGFAFGVAGSFLGLNGTMMLGTAGGLGIGLLDWFVIGLVRMLRAPIDPTETISPADLLRLDRRTALSNGFMGGVGGALVTELVLVLEFETIYRMVTGGYAWLASVAITTIAATMTLVFFFTAWGQWMLARVWLPLRGDLPWAVMAFLADAHKRGVLRQSGGVYQFRHARLQEHLVTATLDERVHLRGRQRVVDDHHRRADHAGPVAGAGLHDA